MGAYRKFHFRKKFIECLFIHAVYINSCIHSNHYMMFVGSLGVFGDWEFEVLSLWSPGGFNMVNYLKHIYPWWIRLSHSHFHRCGCHHHHGVVSGQDWLSWPFSWTGIPCRSVLFVTFLALCILSWTLLSQLVLWFSASHALSFHPWGFSRLMTVI